MIVIIHYLNLDVFVDGIVIFSNALCPPSLWKEALDIIVGLVMSYGVKYLGPY